MALGKTRTSTNAKPILVQVLKFLCQGLINLFIYTKIIPTHYSHVQERNSPPFGSNRLPTLFAFNYPI